MTSIYLVDRRRKTDRRGGSHHVDDSLYHDTCPDRRTDKALNRRRSIFKRNVSIFENQIDLFSE